jgi:hypothetical protein
MELLVDPMRWLQTLAMGARISKNELALGIFLMGLQDYAKQSGAAAPHSKTLARLQSALEKLYVD